MADKKVLRVVGCLIKNNDSILMLFRSQTETDPSLWGIPAGKVEKDEDDREAVLREVLEETGIKLVNDSSLELLGELPIEYPNLTVVFPVFGVKLESQPDVLLSPREHIDFAWMSAESILELPNLMQDVDIIIEKFGRDF